MAGFQGIVADIKSLKIQGAEAVAKAAVSALNIIGQQYRREKKVTLVHNLHKAKDILFKTRPTEPCMRNALNYLLADIEIEEDIAAALNKRTEEANKHFDGAMRKIAIIGAKKINNGMVVFTHCHSSTVTAVLKQAKHEGKKFEVWNTETRPSFQGRITAKELARENIHVRYFIDSAARLALKHADIMLIGADAISAEGKVINKIGSEMFAETAERLDVPVYSCVDSWKFDPKTVFGYEEAIEERIADIWPTAPEGIEIDKHIFEKIKPDLIAGIISELGIYSPEIFVEEAKRAWPWMFK